MVKRAGLLIGLCACTYPEVDFYRDYAEAWCDVARDCDPEFVCPPALGENQQYPYEGSFRDMKARTCVADFEFAECVDGRPEIPQACAEVYDP